jgi:hypothetical protein
MNIPLVQESEARRRAAPADPAAAIEELRKDFGALLVRIAAIEAWIGDPPAEIEPPKKP